MLGAIVVLKFRAQESRLHEYVVLRSYLFNGKSFFIAMDGGELEEFSGCRHQIFEELSVFLNYRNHVA